MVLKSAMPACISHCASVSHTTSKKEKSEKKLKCDKIIIFYINLKLKLSEKVSAVCRTIYLT